MDAKQRLKDKLQGYEQERESSRKWSTAFLWLTLAWLSIALPVGWFYGTTDNLGAMVAIFAAGNALTAALAQIWVSVGKSRSD